MNRRALAAGVAVVLAGLGVAGWFAYDHIRHRPVWTHHQPVPVADRAPFDGPNVVLVIGCTVRKDELSPYGGANTPFLAELADKGTRFDDVVGAAPWTRPAVISLITGHHALQLGMVQPGPDRNARILPDATETLAERLATAGYETVGISANPNVTSRFGMAAGFDAYQNTAGGIKNYKRRAADVIDAALDRLSRRDPNRPFYLQLVVVDVHHPRSGKGGPVKKYRRLLGELDADLRRLHEALPEDTVFVFVSDHGEGLNLPPHHGPRHGFNFYPSVAAIPWIVAGPGIAEGHVVSGLVSQVDVAPTLLSFLGIAHDLPGEDLSRHLQGRKKRSRREVAYSDSWFYRADRAAIWTNKTQCQLEFTNDPELDKDGLMVDGCFRRRADPDFSRPYTDETLLEDLRTWRRDHSADVPAAESASLTADEAAQLRALGYAE